MREYCADSDLSGAPHGIFLCGEIPKCWRALHPSWRRETCMFGVVIVSRDLPLRQARQLPIYRQELWPIHLSRNALRRIFGSLAEKLLAFALMISATIDYIISTSFYHRP